MFTRFYLRIDYRDFRVKVNDKPELYFFSENETDSFIPAGFGLSWIYYRLK